VRGRPARLLVVAAAVASLLGGAVGCGGEEQLETVSVSTPAPDPPAPDGKIVAGTARPQTFVRARQVREDYGDLINEKFRGVVGQGIGLADDASPGGPGSHSFAIVVMVRGPVPAKSWVLSGVPLRFLHTGDFEAQDLGTLEAQ
jgi:hypothetical protein